MDWRQEDFKIRKELISHTNKPVALIMRMKGMYHRALLLISGVPFLFSCASYSKRMLQYDMQLNQRNYTAGITSIEKNKILGKPRNKLLQEMELGRLYQLSGNIVKSNQHLNTADQIMESNFRNVKDVAVGNLVNPMIETFRGEDFEKLTVNYFKGINYCRLGLKDDAVVEARRITLANNRLAEKYGPNIKERRYYTDPFMLNVQGILYEQARDWNNAFIAYRNAADVYLKAGGSYYGVSMPDQLKQDLLHAAHVMGFSDQVSRYEELFHEQRKVRTDSSGELILFIEQGRAPVKDQFVYNIINDGINRPMRYSDPYGNNVNFNFDHRANGVSDQKITDIRTIRVALPFYRPLSITRLPCSIQLDNNEFSPEPAQDFNTLSVGVLQDRFLQELTKAVARYLIKTAVSKGVEKGVESAVKNKAKDEKDPEKKKKKEERAEAAGQLIGFLLNTAGAASEQADTRCWMSLPAFISYVRIPLKSGNNHIDISNQTGTKISLDIKGEKGLHLESVILP